MTEEHRLIQELNKPENKLITECNNKDKQIDLCRSILLDILKEKAEKDKEIERLHSIIKEVREKVEEEIENAKGSIYIELPEEKYIEVFKEFLQILDKVEESKWKIN